MPFFIRFHFVLFKVRELPTAFKQIKNHTAFRPVQVLTLNNLYSGQNPKKLVNNRMPAKTNKIIAVVPVTRF